jgi:PPOX class probable F420-dependent enzyme
MDIATAVAFARDLRRSVLVTTRADGRPQLSNVLHGYDEDAALFRVSLTADRAKYKNLARRPFAALHVTSADFWAYVVLESEAELTEVVTDPSSPAADEHVEHYRRVAGEHPDWDDYRASLVRERRAFARLRPTYAYGMLPRG